MNGMIAAFHYMETYVFLLTTRFRRRKPKCIAVPPGNCPLLIWSVRLDVERVETHEHY
jgi:hypothetical protein